MAYDGDQALIRVSAAIRNAVRSRDIVARLVGKSFMGPADQQQRGNRLAGCRTHSPAVYDLKIPHMFNESVATNVTISIGLTPLIDDNIEQALARADGALYEPKIKDAILFLPASFSFARRGIAAPTNSLPCRLQTTNIRNHYHLDLYLESNGLALPFS